MSYIMTKLNENLLIKNTNKSLADAIDVIDSGTNSNGSYIKFIDGTMICTKSIRFNNINFNTSWGNMYETPLLDLGDFPVSFIEIPAVSILPFNGNSCFAERIKDLTTSNIGKAEFCRPTNGSISFSVNIIAIGKWK